MHVTLRNVLGALGTAVLLLGCGQEAADPAVEPEDFAATLRLQLETAAPGDVIEVPEGVFHFQRGLSLKTDSVTIRGAGADRSVLSFKEQIAGAEGLLVTASDFTIEDLAH